jgi:hypothetical protein
MLAVLMAATLTTTKPSIGIQIAAAFLILLIAMSSSSASLYLLIFSMLLSPEFAAGRVQGRGVGGREITIRLEDILLIVIGFGWFARAIIFREHAVIRYTPVNRPIVYYIVACVVATLLGVAAGRVKPLTGLFFVLKYIEYFVIFFLVVNIVATRAQIEKYLAAALATALFISLFAIAQIPSGERATAPFEGETGEPNTLGGYLVFMMAIACGLLLELPSRALRGTLLIMLVIMGVALMATLSRSSFLAAGVLLCAILATQRRRLGVVMAVLFVFALLPLVSPASVKERVSDTFFGRQYGGEIKIGGAALDLSTTERLRSWQYVFHGWAQRPVFGSGVTGYAWADAQYVKTLGETGLAGMCAFLFMLYRLGRTAREHYRTETDDFCRGLALGFFLGLIAVMAHAIGANSFIIVRIMEPFWLCAGFVMLLSRVPDKVGAATMHPAI